MNAFQIKLLAIVTMVIDHVGLFFFPDLIIFKIIGRIAFPLFAFLIANGAHYSHNLIHYIKRTFLFAVVSQIPFQLANRLRDAQFNTGNVLFTFFLAMLAILAWSKTKNVFITIIVAIAAIAASYFLKTDYGPFGVLLTISFYIFFNNRKAAIGIYILLVLAFSLNVTTNTLNLGRVISAGTLVFILAYNYKSGPKTKYLFYIFYPLQYLIIYTLLKLY